MTPPAIPPKHIDTPKKLRDWDATNEAIAQCVGSIRFYKVDVQRIKRVIAKKEAELKKLRQIRDAMKSGEWWEAREKKSGWTRFEPEEDWV